jgi:hypothetical protein
MASRCRAGGQTLGSLTGGAVWLGERNLAFGATSGGVCTAPSDDRRGRLSKENRNGSGMVLADAFLVPVKSWEAESNLWAWAEGETAVAV